MTKKSKNKKAENAPKAKVLKIKLSDLYRLEDWWAIWFGAILVFFVSIGAISKVPKLGRWTTTPFENLIQQAYPLYTGSAPARYIG